MTLDNILNINGTQAYTVTEGDIVKIVVKGQEEFKFKVPENRQGTVTITIKGALTEIIPS